MAGGYLGTRRRAFGSGTYFPFVLTNEGSVFTLEISSEDARQALLHALRFGLPVPPFGARPLTWRNCPYVPENGYGEIDLIGSPRYRRLPSPDAEETANVL
jgi:hypothetical protein